jgi:hypothetical protein
MAKGDMRYFKTTIHGLQVVVGDPNPQKGEVAPKTETFVPYYILEPGKEGQQRYGFLATDSGSAIKKLAEDYNVTEITEDEFKEATEPVFDEKTGKQIGGLRAPY